MTIGDSACCIGNFAQLHENGKRERATNTYVLYTDIAKAKEEGEKVQKIGERKSKALALMDY